MKKNKLFYISLILVFVILACMIALPFGIKKVTFKNDDIETIHVTNTNNVINEFKRIMFLRIFKTNNFVSTYDESFLSNVELKKVN